MAVMGGAFLDTSSLFHPFPDIPWQCNGDSEWSFLWALNEVLTSHEKGGNKVKIGQK